MQWQGYVASGKDRKEQGRRYKEVPPEFQQQVISHMKTYSEIKNANSSK